MHDGPAHPQGRHGGLVPGGVEYGGALQVVRRLHAGSVAADLFRMRLVGLKVVMVVILRPSNLHCNKLAESSPSAAQVTLYSQPGPPRSSMELPSRYRRMEAI